MTRRVDVGRTKVRAQQMIAAEDVQGEEAVVIVVAVEEAVDLVAMHGIVGGIEVEDQFLGRGLVGIDERLDQDGGDVEQRGSLHAILQAAQRRR